MKDQFGYTPNTGSYPPYFNITKVENGWRVAVRQPAFYDDDNFPLTGPTASVVLPEDFIEKLREFING